MATVLERCRPRLIEACLLRLDAAEVRFVRHQTVAATRPSLRTAARILNGLGSGWLYVAGSAGLFLAVGSEAARALGAAGLSVAAAFSVYPFIKRFVARPRPFVRYCDVRCEGSPLDRYSFPSGHCMTSGAVFVPVGLAFPETTVVLAPLAVSIAWARLALGHHYPSDLACGAALGGAVALTLTAMLPWSVR